MINRFLVWHVYGYYNRLSSASIWSKIKQFRYQLPLFIYSRICSISFLWAPFFSNIWAMQIRFNQSKEAGIWARGFLRKLAMSVTLTTSIIIPISGLMLIESWGGLHGAPWAWNACWLSG